jgi:hypothetical protein
MSEIQETGIRLYPVKATVNGEDIFFYVPKGYEYNQLSEIARRGVRSDPQAERDWKHEGGYEIRLD